ncbi:MAG: hypothetical protein LUG95_08635 [Clostridiales bacterium]|nr:hypothetical protein [Clostridiales bacterium]
MNNKKKKILIVLQFIRRGGVKLVALNFAQNLDRDKYDISILLVAPDEHQKNDLLKEVQESGIKIISFPKKYKIL